MGKKLTDEQDVQATKKSFSHDSKILKFDENSKTPIYILSIDYEEGFVHWVETLDGRRMRVVCGGGVEGKGFDPANCKICNHLVEGYREARALEGEDKQEADKMRKKLNQMRANYSAELLAAKGELLKVKDAKTGKKTLSADFDEYEVGVLALTETQFNALTGLKDSEQYPHVKTYGDLVNRVIIVDKRKRDKGGKGAMYATIEFQPLKAKSDPPDVEYDPDDFDLSEDFVLDEERIEQAFALLSGEEDYDEDVDADIEYETDDAEEAAEEVFDDDVDADEGADLSDVAGEAGEMDDDFDDDLPWDDEETSEPPPKPKPKPKSVTKKSAGRKQVKKTVKKTVRKKPRSK